MDSRAKGHQLMKQATTWMIRGGHNRILGSRANIYVTLRALIAVKGLGDEAEAFKPEIDASNF